VSVVAVQRNTFLVTWLAPELTQSILARASTAIRHEGFFNAPPRTSYKKPPMTEQAAQSRQGVTSLPVGLRRGQRPPSLRPPRSAPVRLGSPLPVSPPRPGSPAARGQRGQPSTRRTRRPRPRHGRTTRPRPGHRAQGPACWHRAGRRRRISAFPRAVLRPTPSAHSSQTGTSSVLPPEQAAGQRGHRYARPRGAPRVHGPHWARRDQTWSPLSRRVHDSSL